jgi:hypothetical protein
MHHPRYVSGGELRRSRADPKAIRYSPALWCVLFELGGEAAYPPRSGWHCAHAFQYKISRSISCGYPALAEQEAIVEAVEDQLSIIDHLEADLDTKMKSVMNLRQAILRHAFTGKLVLQDPDDQSASELLKRIMAEREARAHEPTAVKRAAKKTNSGTGRHKRPVKQKEQVG